MENKKTSSISKDKKLDNQKQSQNKNPSKTSVENPLNSKRCDATQDHC